MFGTVPSPGDRGPSFLRRWAVLIATLAIGSVVIVVIALSWSNGPSSPDPRSLPPPSAASR